MEYLIFILLLLVISWLVISDIVNDRKKSREYKKYIDNIKVGDVFVSNYVDISDDPFVETPDYSEHSKVIVDIKKNNKGETWVKYKWLKIDNGIEYTKELHEFLETQIRVKQSEI